MPECILTIATSLPGSQSLLVWPIFSVTVFYSVTHLLVHPTCPLSSPVIGMPVDHICHPWVFHTICWCTIHASWLFGACQCPTIPAGFPTWLCKLTCYPTTNAGALGMPVDHICHPWVFHILYASALSMPVGSFLHGGVPPYLLGFSTWLCNQCWTPNWTSDCYPTGALGIPQIHILWQCVVPNKVTPYLWVWGAPGIWYIWHSVSIPWIVWFGTL